MNIKVLLDTYFSSQTSDFDFNEIQHSSPILRCDNIIQFTCYCTGPTTLIGCFFKIHCFMRGYCMQKNATGTGKGENALGTCIFQVVDLLEWSKCTSF
jgi:hypothetical protein